MTNKEKPVISHKLSKLFQDIMEKKLNNRFISAGTLIRFRDACIQEGKTQTIKDVKEKINKLQLEDAEGCECPACCFARELLSSLDNKEEKE